ncbi:Guanine nucleotide exchange factor lte1 [Entomophthora muscae]|uniref:Guanine nucleotide exchange factor lte1 n=1 Tax=Entomophthora muscae TaxID=34485 RepID=A0ACC2RSA9_9FUNG|nr:Guanine nucleotide exchange factor lte1 [Entomophthora muscae]
MDVQSYHQDLDALLNLYVEEENLEGVPWPLPRDPKRRSYSDGLDSRAHRAALAKYRASRQEEGRPRSENSYEPGEWLPITRRQSLPDFKSKLDELGAFTTIFDETNEVPVWSEGEELLLGGSVVQLVTILTTKIDYTFMSDFFITYRIFLSRGELLRLLIARYRWALTGHADLQQVVRVRMFVVIRHWLINYFQCDFVEDSSLRQQLADSLMALEESPTLLQSPRDRRIIAELKTILVRLTPSSTSYYLLGSPTDEASKFWGADLSTVKEVCTTTSYSSDQVSVITPCNTTTGLVHPGIYASPSADIRFPHSPPPSIHPRLRKFSSWRVIRSLFTEHTSKVNSSLASEAPHKFKESTHSIISALGTPPEIPDPIKSSHLRSRSSLSRLICAAKAKTMHPPKHILTSQCSATTRLESRLIQESLKNRKSPPLSHSPVVGLIDHVPQIRPLLTGGPTSRTAKSRWLDISVRNRVLNPFRSRCFILDYPSGAVAYQLSLIEARLLSDVTWEEVLLRFFPKCLTSTPPQKLPNLIARFNSVSDWAVAEICTIDNPAEQAKLISKFIRIAHKCYQLANFTTLVQILLALQSPRVTQIGVAWERLSINEAKVLNELVQFTNPFRNWKRLRATMHSIAENWGEVSDGVPSSSEIPRSLACHWPDTSDDIDQVLSSIQSDTFCSRRIMGSIPFMGLYLSDLLHLSELPSFLPKRSIHNRHLSMPIATLPPLTTIPLKTSRSAPNNTRYEAKMLDRNTQSIDISFLTSSLNAQPLDLKLNAPATPKLTIEHEVINFHKFRGIGAIIKRFQTFKRLASNYNQPGPIPTLEALCWNIPNFTQTSS